MPGLAPRDFLRGLGFGFGFGRGFGFGPGFGLGPGLGLGPGAGRGPGCGVGPGCGALFGGGAGCCLKSKQSDMSSDLASRALSDGRPKVVSQNFTRLTCEWKALEM